MSAAPVWVVGAGGLVGRAVAARARRASLEPLTTTVPWTDADACLGTLSDGFDALVRTAGNGTWHVAWCAGAAVVASDAEGTRAELDAFERFLATIADRADDRGTFFLTSSAGVYAGSEPPPFDEQTAPRPLSPYGELKLAMEEALARFAEKTGVRVVVGRLANVYGPGQKLDKPQGLVSQLCRSALTGQPATIFVPLDTTRDYVFVEDVADMVLHALAGRRDLPTDAPVVVKVMASARSASIAELLDLVGEVAGHPVPVVHEDRSAGQARDLRLRSVTWPELDRCATTPLEEGVRRTYDALAEQLEQQPLG